MQISPYTVCGCQPRAGGFRDTRWNPGETCFLEELEVVHLEFDASPDVD